MNQGIWNLKQYISTQKWSRNKCNKICTKCIIRKTTKLWWTKLKNEINGEIFNVYWSHDISIVMMPVLPNWSIDSMQFQSNLSKLLCAYQQTDSRGDFQDGGGVRLGDHLPPHKYIKNTSACGTTPTEHLLNAGRRLHASRKNPTQHCKAVSLQLKKKWTDKKELIPKFIQRDQRPRKASTRLKTKNKIGALTLLNLKTYYTATVIKVMCMEQNRELRNTLTLHSQLISVKGAKIDEAKIVFSTNGAGTNWTSKRKKKKKN